MKDSNRFSKNHSRLLINNVSCDAATTRSVGSCEKVVLDVTTTLTMNVDCMMNIIVGDWSKLDWATRRDFARRVALLDLHDTELLMKKGGDEETEDRKFEWR